MTASQPIELNHKLWPERFVPDYIALAKSDSEEPFLRAAFQLLKEAGTSLALAAGVMPDAPYGRNEAILCGHLVRASKLAMALIADMANRSGDQQMAISRQFLDSASTLFYLLDDDGSGSRFDAYVMDSLVAEREFLKNVRANIHYRKGRVLPIEERLERSISRAAEAAGVSLDQLPPRKQIAWPSAEERLKLLGAAAYSSYRMGSNAIHGSWSHLYQSHLVEEDGSFAPDFDHARPRPQAPLMVALLAVEMIRAHLAHRGARYLDVFQERLAELQERLYETDRLHEEFLQRRGSR